MNEEGLAWIKEGVDELEKIRKALEIIARRLTSEIDIVCSDFTDGIPQSYTILGAGVNGPPALPEQPSRE